MALPLRCKRFAFTS